MRVSQIVNINLSRIGYTYVFTTSKLLGGTYGSHEIHLSYSFDIDGKRQSRRSKSNRKDIQYPINM